MVGIPMFYEALLNIMKGFQMLGTTAGGVTDGSMLYMVHVTDHPAGHIFSWQSLGKLGGVALLAARKVSNTWNSVKVGAQNIPTEHNMTPKTCFENR